jgi:hypothetical protein
LIHTPLFLFVDGRFRTSPQSGQAMGIWFRSGNQTLRHREHGSIVTFQNPFMMKSPSHRKTAARIRFDEVESQTVIDLEQTLLDIQAERFVVVAEDVIEIMGVRFSRQEGDF